MDIDTATRLSAERTRLAYEGTLLSWVRTAISLITFGFAIYKFSADLRGNNAVSEQGAGSDRATDELSCGSIGLREAVIPPCHENVKFLGEREPR